ncbi:hypothetical protein ACFWOL_30735 [Streptomyces sp. NPDC058442]|uniref:hypothetical protein n=1 Tax=Streptomyces sp. NPDC058442 TaxID=3346503 RepID=UPI003669CB94
MPGAGLPAAGAVASSGASSGLAGAVVVALSHGGPGMRCERPQGPVARPERPAALPAIVDEAGAAPAPRRPRPAGAGVESARRAVPPRRFTGVLCTGPGRLKGTDRVLLAELTGTCPETTALAGRV